MTQPVIRQYEREAVAQYIDRWSFIKNSFYADASQNVSNNVSFAYQAVSYGGYFENAYSAYLDFYQKDRMPVISKYSNFHKALINEVKAVFLENTSLNHEELRTGDIVVASRSNQRYLYVINILDKAYYYANSPYIRKADTIVADSYSLYFLPEYFEV